MCYAAGSLADGLMQRCLHGVCLLVVPITNDAGGSALLRFKLSLFPPCPAMTPAVRYLPTVQVMHGRHLTTIGKARPAKYSCLRLKVT
jgi:hypothetical protein